MNGIRFGIDFLLICFSLREGIYNNYNNAEPIE